MSEAFPQTRMTPVYGVCHYFIRLAFDMFFRGEIRGLDNLPRDGAFLIAANHASLLDPPLIGCHVGRQIAFFARRTLWRGGIASWWLDAVGTIPVDRDSGQDISALKRVLRSLGEGRAVILFPEGTRSPDGQLQAPKPGVGFIVCKAQIPVVPARIFGSFEALGRNMKFPRLDSPVDVVFGPPLPPSEYDRGEGKERYPVASGQIMDAIARLERPIPSVL